MTVHVVMSNDFPDCVFSTAAAAGAYVDRCNVADKEVAKREGRMRIYYRSYAFEVQA